MKAIILHSKDNVAAVSDEVKAGAMISIDENNQLTATQDIPEKHKVAVNDIEKGGVVVRYGQAIGPAKEKTATTLRLLPPPPKLRPSISARK